MSNAARHRPQSRRADGVPHPPFSTKQPCYRCTRVSYYCFSCYSPLVVAAEAMECAEVAQGVAFAPDPFVELDEVAMGLGDQRITFSGALETLQGELEFLAFALEQTQAQMDLGVGRHEHRGAV